MPKLCIRALQVTLDHAVKHDGYTKIPLSLAARFGDFHAPYRLWLITPVQQVLFKRCPVHAYVGGKFTDLHAIDARASVVAYNPLVSFPQIPLLQHPRELCSRSINALVS
jgi:hypothetical protein